MMLIKLFILFDHQGCLWLRKHGGRPSLCSALDRAQLVIRGSERRVAAPPVRMSIREQEPGRCPGRAASPVRISRSRCENSQGWLQRWTGSCQQVYIILVRQQQVWKGVFIQYCSKNPDKKISIFILAKKCTDFHISWRSVQPVLQCWALLITFVCCRN